MRVRKKPIVVDAVQWTGKNTEEVSAFLHNALLGNLGFIVEDAPIIIATLEGDHKANVGDWIIKGVKGEFYPRKPDIFEQTYEFGRNLIPEPVSLLELCRNILELARHGDYANGNTAQGIDEGEVMAGRMMADYEAQIRKFEKTEQSK